MNEIIYAQNSAVVMAGLLIGAALAVEAGYRLGRHERASPREAIAQANAVLVSMLSLLALLLAFTFAAALQRYNDRSDSVVAEANAIGTTYLRARLLPGGMADEVQALLREYLDLRIQEGRTDATQPIEREKLLQAAKRMEARLWSHATRAAELDDGVVTSGLFIQSLNQLIDTSTTRNAVLDRHVPEIALLVMFATYLMTAAALGHASGTAGHRATLSSLVLLGLIALVFHLIMDLDRPRRGAIQVSQDSMVRLQQAIGLPAPGQAPPDRRPDASPATPR